MPKEVVIPEGTEEERALYMKLIKKFGLKVKKTIEPIKDAVKVIKSESYCSLCETTTIEYVKMLKYTDGIWKKDSIITEGEAGKILHRGTHKDTVTCCQSCVDFLMEKDKMELVKIIMRSKSPILINKAIKKVVNNMQEDSNDE